MMLNIATTLLSCCVLLVVLPKETCSAPAPIEGKFQALTYLTQFGYIEGSSNDRGNLVTEDAVKEALMEFQRFAGINQTGTLDNETMTLMNTPRCGVKDKVGHGDARKKRYAQQGSRWGTKQLTYGVNKYPSSKGLTKTAIDDEMEKALKVWSDHTQLTFTAKKSGRINIDIAFESGEHGDGDPFDGSGGILAHAFFPKYGGDAHFDDDERWTLNSYRGTNLLQVAAHEFGHSLGLSHSDVQAALMAPFYRGYQPNFKLHDDDIRAIQSLYGKKQAEGPSKGKPTPPRKPSGGGDEEEGELCTDSVIDAICTVDDHTFAFKGDYYWEVIDTGLADGYPRLISKDFRGLPSNIDAAFTYSNKKTYFFKDSQYWRFTGKNKDTGYPKTIKTGFPSIPNNVDAAFLWGGNDKIYFFKGDKYWKFDPDRRPSVSREYPKAISTWKGIPNNINAAFQWTNHYTYFFKGTYYWRFNDRNFAVDKASPAFPRSSAYWWFGCKSMTAGNAQIPIASSLSKDLGAELDVEENDDVSLHQPDDKTVYYKNNNNAGYSVIFSVHLLLVAMLAQFVLL